MLYKASYKLTENITFLSCNFQVYNFLPSVSAAIGHYRPQKNVWKTAIALQAIVRILVFKLYHRYYKEHVYKWARYLSNIALVMYAIENISLVTLSFWSSDENYGKCKCMQLRICINMYTNI